MVKTTWKSRNYDTKITSEGNDFFLKIAVILIVCMNYNSKQLTFNTEYERGLLKQEISVLKTQ